MPRQSGEHVLLGQPIAPVAEDTDPTSFAVEVPCEGHEDGLNVVERLRTSLGSAQRDGTFGGSNHGYGKCSRRVNVPPSFGAEFS